VNLHVIRGELDRFTSELRVKMLKVLLRSHIRLVWRDDLLGVKQRPVDSPEEWMRLDVSEASLRMTAEPVLGVLTPATHVSLVVTHWSQST